MCALQTVYMYIWFDVCIHVHMQVLYSVYLYPRFLLFGWADCIFVIIFSCYSDEELEHYLNDEDAVVQIDQYISKLEVVSSLLVMQSDESKL